MPHLLEVTWRPGADARRAADAPFPFCVPAVRSLERLAFTTDVTLFVGENGSGKSTVLEALAIAAELPAAGSHDLARDGSLAPQRALADAWRLSWSRRSRRGLFLRAEDFFGYLRRQAMDDARILRERDEAAGVAEADPDATLETVVGIDLLASDRHLARHDARSHGESFLEFFATRIRGPGLYLLDEPEAPLSPQRQIALLGLLLDAAHAGAQLVVATHSPILLACPGARILDFDATPVAEVRYDELEHVRTTRDFLNDPERWLRHLRP